MTRRGYRIAIVGATGAVGTIVRQVLHERRFPVAEVVAFASERSVGTKVPFGDDLLECQALTPSAVEGFDLAISSAGGAVSRDWALQFAAAGALVIDKSSAWRMDEEVPLVVAEVNPDAVLAAKRGIISSPNCSTMQMVVALKPILDAVGLERIVVSTYQSVSGTGQRAMDELSQQTAAALTGNEMAEPVAYPHQIAFNVIPQVESFKDGDPYTTEERKMMDETRKILDDESIGISATCARVPVMIGHSESINIQTRTPLSADDCRELLSAAPSVTVVDDPALGRYPLPLEAEGRDDVLVGRIREDLSAERSLNLWVVGDNLRKGAATNAIQIAELLHERDLLDAESRSGLAPAV